MQSPLDTSSAVGLRYNDSMRWAVSVLLSVLLLGAPAAARSAQDAEADRLPPAASGDALQVAIAPFINVSQAPADEWLGVGIAETVAAELSRVPGVTVVYPARNGAAAAPVWVLRGSYQRLGDQIRITATLVDPVAGATRHTAKLDGTIDGVFALQDAVAAEVRRALSGATTASRRAAASSPRPRTST